MIKTTSKTAPKSTPKPSKKTAPPTDRAKNGKARAAAPGKADKGSPVPLASKGKGYIDTLVTLLRRPAGVTTAEVVAAIPTWQEHTARARIGSDIVKAGHKVLREKVEARGGTVYRIQA